MGLLLAAPPRSGTANQTWFEILHDDFESGLDPAHWFIVEQSFPATDTFLGAVGPDDLGTDLGTSVGFLDTSGGGDAELIRRAFGPLTDLAVEWRERHDSLDEHLRFTVGGPGAPGIGGFTIATFGNAGPAGRILLSTGAGLHDVAAWSPGRWHTYRVELHCGPKVFDFFLDGVLVAANQPFQLPMTSANAYFFETGGAASSSGARYIDEVREFVMGAPAVALDLDPDTLNLRSRGVPVTAYIEVPWANAADIDRTTLLLLPTPTSSVPVMPSPMALGDHDNDGVPDLMVKFDRDSVNGALAGVSGLTTICVVGSLTDGTPILGQDVIRVIP